MANSPAHAAPLRSRRPPRRPAVPARRPRRLRRRGSGQRPGRRGAARRGAGDRGRRGSRRRSTPASDEQCAAVPSTPSVSEAALLAYEKGAVHRALAFQQALGDDLPLRFAPWIGTHNSFNSSAQDPTLSPARRQPAAVDGRPAEASTSAAWSWTPTGSRAPPQRGPTRPSSATPRSAEQKHAGCTTERPPVDGLPRDRHAAEGAPGARSCWCTWRTTSRSTPAMPRPRRP